MDLFQLWNEWSEVMRSAPPPNRAWQHHGPAKKKPVLETHSLLVLDRPAEKKALWAPSDHHRDGYQKLGFPETARRSLCTPTTISNGSKFRAACMGCGWVSSAERDHLGAVLEANDHSHPGWRDTPRIKDLGTAAGADLRASRVEWTKKVAPLFPAGWFDRGGPVVTMRAGAPYASHVPGGGYDLPGLAKGTPARKRLRSGKVHLVVPPPKKTRWGYDQGGEWDSMVYDPETDAVVSVPNLRQREARREKEAAAAAAGIDPAVVVDEDVCDECGEPLDDCQCYGDDDD